MCVFISVESEANLKLGGTRLIKNRDKQKKKKVFGLRLSITFFFLNFLNSPTPMYIN